MPKAASPPPSTGEGREQSMGQDGNGPGKKRPAKENAASKADHIPLVQAVVAELGHPEDLMTRQLRLDGQTVEIVFIDGLVDRTTIQDTIVNRLQREALRRRAQVSRRSGITLQDAEASMVGTPHLERVEELDQIINRLLEGGTLIAADNWKQALMASTEGWEKRDITEPDTESVVRGSREGFTENLRTNTALVRRRLRSRDLVLERLRVGSVSNTPVTIMYLKGIAHESLLAEVKQRLARVDINGVLESGYLEEWIEDNPFSPFPQVQYTERPDRVAAALLQGKVAIMADNTPMALIVPTTLNSLMHAPDDYSERSWLSLPVRLVRYTGLIFTLLLPATYVALTSYHVELVPTPLMLSLIRQRETVPYPSVVEALGMELVLQILIEAGVRLPRPVGSAVTIVGAIVIGDAAVSAGLVSATMVITASLTALASFTIPAYNLGATIRWLGVLLIIPASILGILGLLFGIMALLIHLANLRSFGVPYLVPTAPMVWESNREDMLWRSYHWRQPFRPQFLARRETRSIGSSEATGLQGWKPPQQPPARESKHLELERSYSATARGRTR
ncbi:MAG: spore germination protein [Limnochordales bacterium]|nr:spore germination protein [Limnochordales bacterium]